MNDNDDDGYDDAVYGTYTVVNYLLLQDLSIIYISYDLIWLMHTYCMIVR
jgi:hypothetical protein